MDLNDQNVIIGLSLVCAVTVIIVLVISLLVSFKNLLDNRQLLQLRCRHVSDPVFCWKPFSMYSIGQTGQLFSILFCIFVIGELCVYIFSEQLSRVLPPALVSESPRLFIIVSRVSDAWFLLVLATCVDRFVTCCHSGVCGDPKEIAIRRVPIMALKGFVIVGALAEILLVIFTNVSTDHSSQWVGAGYRVVFLTLVLVLMLYSRTNDYRTMMMTSNLNLSPEQRRRFASLLLTITVTTVAFMAGTIVVVAVHMTLVIFSSHDYFSTILIELGIRFVQFPAILVAVIVAYTTRHAEYEASVSLSALPSSKSDMLSESPSIPPPRIVSSLRLSLSMDFNKNSRSRLSIDDDDIELQDQSRVKGLSKLKLPAQPLSTSINRSDD